jgi:DNA-binding CsgD family transcriptional regulator
MPTTIPHAPAIDRKLLRLKLSKMHEEHDAKTKAMAEDIAWKRRQTSDESHIPGEIIELVRTQLADWAKVVSQVCEEVLEIQEIERTPEFLETSAYRVLRSEIRREKICIMRLTDNVFAAKGLLVLVSPGTDRELRHSVPNLMEMLKKDIQIEANELKYRLAALKRKEQGSAGSEARAIETNSESVSVHDKKAEPVQETVGQTMTAQTPLGTIRNARHEKKQDLSRYLDAAKLTDRQYQCASLRWEYGLAVSQIARELKRHRKTVDQHIHSAQAKMRSSGLNEKMQKRLSQVRPGE